MKEILYGGSVIARHIKKEDIKKGLNFYSKDKEYIQVGIWGEYENGKDLGTHVHNEFERISSRTHEMIFVISGKLEAKIYSLDMKFVETIVVEKEDILILLECCHGYRILENNTTVLETKNGPYFGPEKDRKKL